MNVAPSFLEYYFSFPQARRMYAEPDIANYRSIRLLERCGFDYVKTIDMSYKQANVFCLEKDRWSESLTVKDNMHR